MTVAVIGGGLAGGAAACLLARAGRDVSVFEREAAPHDKVCGEFLSGEAAGNLARLGLDLPGLGAVPIHTLRLLHGTACATAPLPFAAWGLSRRVLDEAVLDQAARLGARVLRGQTVRTADAAGVSLADGGQVPAAAVLLATGKHDLRSARRQPRHPPEDLVGLKMHYRLHPDQAAALAGHIEVLLFGRGEYAGLQPIEDGRANLCLLVRRDRAGDWDAMVAALSAQCPHLARRLAGARALLDRPPAVARVPYGFVHRPAAGEGLYRLGDQAGVIPSLCGDGMAIALHSAALAARAVLRRQGAPEYHRHLRRDIGWQIARAQWLHRAVRGVPAAVLRAVAFWPGLMPLAARLTRVPDRAAQRVISIPIVTAA